MTGSNQHQALRWRREDVQPRQLWLSPNGDVWEVQGIADEPTATLVRWNGSDREHHVISSLNFAAWRKLQPTEPA